MIDWLDANLITIVDGVAFGLLLFTLAAGLSLVFGAMDVLNLAHGSFYLVGGVLAYEFSDGTWTGFVIALMLGVVGGAIGGVALAVLTAPLSRRSHLDQALLTIGVAFIAADLFGERFGGMTLPTMPPAELDGVTWIAGHAYPLYRLVFIGVAVALAIAVYLLFERTNAGALVRATVADREMVRALGVDTRVVVGGVCAAGAALAVAGGVLGAPILAPGPGTDTDVLVLSLVVIVIGGLGSIRGALLGALLVGQVQSLGVSLLPQYASFLLFGSMLAVLTLRPRGLAVAGSRS